MTTAATALREAIVTRLSALPGYVEIRRTPVPQQQPDKLPSLLVFILSERLMPDGDGNAGPLHFLSDVTIGIADVRGFEDPATLDGQVDAAIDLIETTLFTDPTFVHFGDGALFESITSINRRRLFPQDGETYFAEVRLEIGFALRVDFEPTFLDDYEKTWLTTRPLGKDANTPSIRTVIDQAE